MEKFAGLSLLYPLILNYVVKKLATTCVLHDKVQLLRGFNNL